MLGHRGMFLRRAMLGRRAARHNGGVTALMNSHLLVQRHGQYEGVPIIIEMMSKISMC